MRLSGLQKFILNEAYSHKKNVDRKLFNRFYLKQKNVPKGEDKVKIITKSIDRLISKGLLIGFGQKTQHKSFIKEVRLTRVGHLIAKKLMGEQVSLPFKKTKKQ